MLRRTAMQDSQLTFFGEDRSTDFLMSSQDASPQQRRAVGSRETLDNDPNCSEIYLLRSWYVLQSEDPISENRHTLSHIFHLSVTDGSFILIYMIWVKCTVNSGSLKEKIAPPKQSSVCSPSIPDCGSKFPFAFPWMIHIIFMVLERCKYLIWTRKKSKLLQFKVGL